MRTKLAHVQIIIITDKTNLAEKSNNKTQISTFHTAFLTTLDICTLHTATLYHKQTFNAFETFLKYPK